MVKNNENGEKKFSLLAKIVTFAIAILTFIITSTVGMLTYFVSAKDFKDKLVDMNYKVEKLRKETTDQAVQLQKQQAIDRTTSIMFYLQSKRDDLRKEIEQAKLRGETTTKLEAELSDTLCKLQSIYDAMAKENIGADQ